MKIGGPPRRSGQALTEEKRMKEQTPTVLIVDVDGNDAGDTAPESRSK